MTTDPNVADPNERREHYLRIKDLHDTTEAVHEAERHRRRVKHLQAQAIRAALDDHMTVRGVAHLTGLSTSRVNQIRREQPDDELIASIEVERWEVIKVVDNKPDGPSWADMAEQPTITTERTE